MTNKVEFGWIKQNVMKRNQLTVSMIEQKSLKTKPNQSKEEWNNESHDELNNELNNELNSKSNNESNNESNNKSNNE